MEAQIVHVPCFSSHVGVVDSAFLSECLRRQFSQEPAEYEHPRSELRTANYEQERSEQQTTNNYDGNYEQQTTNTSEVNYEQQIANNNEPHYEQQTANNYEQQLEKPTEVVRDSVTTREPLEVSTARWAEDGRVRKTRPDQTGLRTHRYVLSSY